MSFVSAALGSRKGGLRTHTGSCRGGALNHPSRLIFAAAALGPGSLSRSVCHDGTGDTGSFCLRLVSSSFVIRGDVNDSFTVLCFRRARRPIILNYPITFVDSVSSFWDRSVSIFVETVETDGDQRVPYLLTVA